MINRLRLHPFRISLMTGLAAFSVYFMISSVTLANPLVAEQFHLGTREMGLLIQAHLLGTVMFLIPAARLGDRFSHLRIFACGALVFAVSSLLCAASGSGTEIIIFRFIQGIGDGMMIATSLVLLTRTYGENKTGKALGFFLFAGYSGYIAGMIPGSIMAEIFGWKAVFFAVFFSAAAAFLIALKMMQKEKFKAKDKKAEFDAAGMILFCPAIILITSGISDLLSPDAAPKLAAGAALILLLIIREKKAENPLFIPGIFRKNRLFSLSVLADLLYYTTIGCITFTLSIYLQSGLLYSTIAAGILLLPASAVQGGLSPLTGHLSDKIEPRYLTAAGMAVVVATLIFFAAAGTKADAFAISIALAFTGAGYALFSSPNKNAIMNSVEKNLQGEASGIANTFEQTGNLISISIATMIITAFAGTSEITNENLPQFIDGMQAVFGVTAVLGIITAAICLMRGRLRQR